jgi:hypothetical protein
MKNITDYKCPICGAFLYSQVGTKIDPNDGINVECTNVECSMADWGHGKTAKDAFNIFRQKCGVDNERIISKK